MSMTSRPQRVARAWMVAACVLLPALGAGAQTTTGAIAGTVTDASGAVVPGVTITSTNLATGTARVAQSDTQGRYVIQALPVGPYVVRFELAGFKGLTRRGIVVEIQQTIRVDASLDVGQVEDSIAVEGRAPLVNTSNATIGRTVNNAEITNLPLVNRDIYSLLPLTQGVDLSESGTVFGFPTQKTLVNGSPSGGAGSVNYTLDGGANMNGFVNSGNAAPNPDAVQEFRVVTNSYSAEYGRFAGGAIDIITKSGTNAFAGSAFNYFRDDALNARAWNTSTKPPLRRNQYGATLGGPLRRNHAFFFGSFSGLRQKQQVVRNTAVVPTALERAGDFSQSPRKPIDPLTRQPFPGGVIPATRFDATARAVLDRAIPIANVPGGFFEAIEPVPLNTDELFAKIDYNLGASQRLTAGYFRSAGNRLESLLGNLPWSQRDFRWTQQNFNAAHAWTLSSTTLNDIRATYVRNYGKRVSSPAQTLADFGANFLVQEPQALPHLAVSGYFTLGQAISGPKAGSDYYGVRETVTLTRGAHLVKIGGEFSFEQVINASSLNNYGIFSFDGSRTGNALADFLLGLPRAMNQDAPITFRDDIRYFSAFVQDDFRVRPRVTLNLGLRYDLQPPTTDPQDRKQTFIDGRQSTIVPTAPPGLLFPGDEGIGRGVVEADRNNVAPRLGVAWDITGTGRTAVRAAFGAFYGSIAANTWAQTSNRQPFSIRQSFPNVLSLSNPYGNVPGGSPYPYVYDPANPRFVNPISVSGISTDFKWPVTYQTSLSIQQQISGDTSVTVAYVGAEGRNLPYLIDINYPVYAANATASNHQQRRPRPGYDVIYLLQSNMTASYHGLQISGERRMNKGLQVKAFYSFGKGLEDARLQNDTNEGGAQSFADLAAERGRTDNDRRHAAVIATVWQTQALADSPAIVRGALANWTISAIGTFRSGAPFSVLAGLDRNLDGTNNDRANLVGDPSLPSGRSREEQSAAWFNIAAFALPDVGQNGSSGRNILDGPGLKTIDLAVFRGFDLQRFKLEMRFEATNVLNWVNMGMPNANLRSPAFGTIRSARAMRELQLGLRMTF